MHYELGLNAKGTRTNIEQLDEGGKYSWIKACRAGAGTPWRSLDRSPGTWLAMPKATSTSRIR
ncbi:MAG: hypothetical protein R3F17_13430 [Planctomycetota bacterium]